MNKKHDKLRREFGEPEDEKETDHEYQPSVSTMNQSMRCQINKMWTLSRQN